MGLPLPAGSWEALHCLSGSARRCSTGLFLALPWAGTLPQQEAARGLLPPLLTSPPCFSEPDPLSRGRLSTPPILWLCGAAVADTQAGSSEWPAPVAAGFPRTSGEGAALSVQKGCSPGEREAPRPSQQRGLPPDPPGCTGPREEEHLCLPGHLTPRARVAGGVPPRGLPGPAPGPRDVPVLLQELPGNPLAIPQDPPRAEGHEGARGGALAPATRDGPRTGFGRC